MPQAEQGRNTPARRLAGRMPGSHNYDTATAGRTSMAHRTDLLSAIQGEIEERIAALRPLLAEYEQLLAATDALDAGEPGAAGASAASPEAASRRGRRPAARGSAAGAIRRASSGSVRKRTAAPAGGTRKPRAGRGAAREAILGALEHGSHTVAELVTVTAMSAANISGNVRRLLAEGAISKTGREGKAAYVLAGSEAQAA